MAMWLLLAGLAAQSAMAAVFDTSAKPNPKAEAHARQSVDALTAALAGPITMQSERKLDIADAEALAGHIKADMAMQSKKRAREAREKAASGKEDWDEEEEQEEHAEEAEETKDEEEEAAIPKLTPSPKLTPTPLKQNHLRASSTKAAAVLPSNLSSAMDADSMEKTLTDLMLSGGKLGATPFGKSVQTIRDLIEADMMPKVTFAHKANQDQLNQLAKESHECASTKNVQVKRANLKKAVYLKTSPLHKTCRAGEAGKHTEKIDCLTEERDKKGIMDLKCKEFAMIAKRYGDQQANTQIVKKSGSEGTESYIRRMTSTMCGRYPPGGKGGGGKGGFLDYYMIAKEGCEHATMRYNAQVRKCKVVSKQYADKKTECDSLQDQMDIAACKRAVQMKDACETYSECYVDRKSTFTDAVKMVKVEEKDRKAEWKGLKRMQCLMEGFKDGKITNEEIADCKKHAHDTSHLIIKYPKLLKLAVCSVPKRYPSTPEYKLAEFAKLPSLAKGREDANQCTNVKPIPTVPNKFSPKTCKCERATLNGPYSPGPLVKCSNCLDVRRSKDRNSCPEGTKLFSPRSQEDWKTIFASVGELNDPNFIVDITRPQNGCKFCNKKPMSSKDPNGQGTEWQTSDGSPWWLRSQRYKEPSGDYHANCYLGVKKPYDDVKNLHFNDADCKYHSRSYYCQLIDQPMKPKKGSPASCKCESVVLTGHYSAGALIKCSGCLDVSRSRQKNSCPTGTKIFSPSGAGDWKTFLASAQPLRSPHWIIDVTRPQNGCGGCTKYPMNSKSPPQMTWRTSDSSPWWLRNGKYTEPTKDYHANCYMDLFKPPASENSVVFRTKQCKYHSNSYFCQPVKKKKATSTDSDDS